MRPFELSAADSALLVIDVQERFVAAVPGISEGQPVARTCAQLMAAAAALQVPTLISEQYPKGLGATVPHLTRINPEAPRHPKMHFSCMDDPVLRMKIEALHRRTLVLCGIEAHVCVLHTAADLLGAGHEVVICADGVASRQEAHCRQALAAARDLGALVLPGESIVMRWTRVAGTPLFKQISALIK
jgi:nicotinamidase-related amidase